MRRSLRQMERASVEQITRYQERRLRALVMFAALRSPFYREWFAGSGVDPRSIRTLDDLQKLPLLDRSVLTGDPERFSTYPSALTWSASSSGTSGRVVRVRRTPGSSAFELSALERQWSWFGVEARPRSLLLRGSDPDPRGAGVLLREIPAARKLVVSSFRLGADELPELLRRVRLFEPEVIEGWPSSLTILASLLKEQGLAIPVRAVITSSEVTSSAQVELFREVFDGPVVDHYGQTERVAMAGNCEADGFHEFPDYGIVELLPVDGRTDRAEIVGTPLHNWGFPLFRYRTGDEVGPSSPEPCPCGRAFRLLGKVDGRVEDVFTSAAGRLLPVPSIVLDDLVGLRESQVVQLAPGHFEFRFVPSSSTDLLAAEERARESVDKYFGPGQTVSFKVMEKIPRGPSGKLKAAVLA
jgi:phenylacetate-CoA ligase